jgi:hypothetical protein
MGLDQEEGIRGDVEEGLRPEVGHQLVEGLQGEGTEVVEDVFWGVRREGGGREEGGGGREGGGRREEGRGTNHPSRAPPLHQHDLYAGPWRGTHPME